jgi:HemK-related putative methylase
MNVLTRQLIRASLPAQRALLRRRLGRVVLEEVDGITLAVLPDVFNGVVFRSGAFLARTLAALLKAQAPAPNAPYVLDMGTGSGIGAMFAARAGCRVTAVDINPEAVRCARINALINHVEARVQAIEGDLFSAVVGRSFDYVLFNPPFFRGEPEQLLDKAWRAESVIERFAQGLPAALAPHGKALVVFSSHGNEDLLLRLFALAGLRVEIEAQNDLGTEVLSVYRVERGA